MGFFCRGFCWFVLGFCFLKICSFCLWLFFVVFWLKIRLFVVWLVGVGGGCFFSFRLRSVVERADTAFLFL